VNTLAVACLTVGVAMLISAAALAHGGSPYLAMVVCTAGGLFIGAALVNWNLPNPRKRRRRRSRW
jgi:peptidoglycan/LPS O-acetylase OafA/YrhL